MIVSFSLLMIVRQNTFQKDDSREKNILVGSQRIGVSPLCCFGSFIVTSNFGISSTLTPLQTTEIRLLISIFIFIFNFLKKIFGICLIKTDQ